MKVINKSSKKSFIIFQLFLKEINSTLVLKFLKYKYNSEILRKKNFKEKKMMTRKR